MNHSCKSNLLLSINRRILQPKNPNIESQPSETLITYYSGTYEYEIIDALYQHVCLNGLTKEYTEYCTRSQTQMMLNLLVMHQNCQIFAPFMLLFKLSGQHMRYINRHNYQRYPQQRAVASSYICPTLLVLHHPARCYFAALGNRHSHEQRTTVNHPAYGIR